MDAETIGKLEQPLDNNLVAYRDGPGKVRLAYIEGHVAIAQANRLFGFGGWGVEHIGDPIISRFGDKTFYSIRVKVTVAGSESYMDVGVGIAERDTPDAHEMAIKGAATDGLKRALRHWGAQMGNDLYAKDNPQRNEANTKGQQGARQQAQNQNRQQQAAPAPQWNGQRPASGPAPTPAAPAPPAAAEKADRGDRRLAVWLLKEHEVKSDKDELFTIIDHWLTGEFNVGIKDFGAAPEADRDKIMAFVSKPEVVAWLEGEKAGLRD